MNNRTFRALTSHPLAERMEEVAAMTKHVAYNNVGVGKMCGCDIETEHDSATGTTLTWKQIAARKDLREEAS